MITSPLGHALIVLAAAGGVAFWITLVLMAARRPYFRHPHQEQIPGKIRGGVHLGDPRSQGPPENEDVTAQEQPGPAADREMPAAREAAGRR